VLVVDETALQAGQANSTGVSNIQALQHLVEWQKVSRPRHPLGSAEGCTTIKGCTEIEGCTEWKAVRNGRLYGIEGCTESKAVRNRRLYRIKGCTESKAVQIKGPSFWSAFCMAVDALAKALQFSFDSEAL
jgi:hypothetical protein